MTNNCGVYKITNTVTGDFYIGSSVNLRGRLSHHRLALNGNRHANMHLQHSWNKYGENSFTFETLELCEQARVLEREQFYIDNKKPTYNILPIAGSCLGVKRSKETKRKMSEAQKGRSINVEQKRHMSEASMGKPKPWLLGKHHSEETKRKISESLNGERNPNFGKPVSEETRRKLSEAQRGMPHPWAVGNQHALGYKHTEEAKRKISEAGMGRVVSEETRRKIGETKIGNTNMVGKHHSEETKQKMSDAAIGRIVTDETKQKLSESARRWWAQRKAEAI